jgi:hypothetical protein
MPLKIKSVSGSVTLDAQNVSGDQTLTVPSQSGATLQTTADTITSSRLSGNLPALNASSLTNLPAGNLTGALPAISGSSLTNLPAGGVAGIVSSANATAITIDSGEHVFVGATAYSGGGDTPVLYVSNSTSTRQMKIHNPASGTSMLQITNATTGQGDDNGLHVYMRSTGKAVINNVENNDLAFSTNNTERLLIKNDGRGLSQFTAKAWVNFNGESSGFRDSHNVSSISDITSGRHYVNFSNSMANTNYCISGSLADSSGLTSNRDCIFQAVPNSTSRCIVNAYCGGQSDMQWFSVLVFGD